MHKSSAYRIYLPQKLDPKGNISITDTNKIHYIRNVLRLKLDDVIRTFNDKDGEFSTKIILCDKKEIELTFLDDKLHKKPVVLPRISIAPSMIKNDRFADLVDMSVQSGVGEIYPLITKNTVHRKMNPERLERIIIESTEQSERFTPAKIHNPTNLREMDFDQFEYVIYANERDDGDDSIDLSILASSNILLLTGPEGGFTADELDFLSKLPNSYSISLGPSILRAETAMIRLISYVDLSRRKA